MSTGKSRFVVSAAWVEKQLGAPEFRVIDASWYLPSHNRNGAVDYAAGHIPGAVYFDQDVIADKASGLPHTLPSPAQFAEAMGQFGIRETDTIVVYDGLGFFSAPRVWWMLRTMGAERVYVLDGGFDGWKAEGRPVETDLPEPAPVTFTPNFRRERVTSLQQRLEIVETGTRQIADARPAGRFTGADAEPRAGMRAGHMPGARNLPAVSLSENGHLKDLATLRKLVEDAGIDLEKPVVTSCGSGVTASVIALALESLGVNDYTLYDGSWSEWGSLPETPVVTGDADAIERGEHGPVKAHVTLLEMTAPPKASLPMPVNIQTALMRATDIPLPFYRFLYTQVGMRYHWHERLRMSDVELKSVLNDPRTSVTVLYINGAPAGYFELFKQDDDVVELAYFGLFERAIGLGVGKWFLLQALYAAWALNPQKVIVSTNTQDHPRALQLYQRYGFAPYQTYETLVDPVSDAELLAVFKRDMRG